MQDTPFFAPETIFLFSAKIYLDIFAKIAQNNIVDDAWLSLVERCVRDAEAAGSNPVASRAECRSLSGIFFMFFKPQADVYSALTIFAVPFFSSVRYSMVKPSPISRFCRALLTSESVSNWNAATVPSLNVTSAVCGSVRPLKTA